MGEVIMTWFHSSITPELTNDGELWTTVTERENDVFSQYAEASVAASKYVIMVDKDNVAFPHLLQGQGQNRIDVTSIYVALDAAVNTSGTLRIGVIRRIDGTDADIWYIAGIPFLATTTQFILSLRGVPSQVKLDIGGPSGTQLLHGITNSEETSIAGVNTVTALDSPAGVATVIPAIGDVIAKLEHVSGGAFNIGLFTFYHGHN
jgi:hypothetical protein